MNSNMFVDAVKLYAMDSAINDVFCSLTNLSAREKDTELIKNSKWFISLNYESKNRILSIMADAVHASMFGLMCIIDGERIIENSGEKGRFKLIYQRGEESPIILNDQIGNTLHDSLISSVEYQASVASNPDLKIKFININR